MATIGGIARGVAAAGLVAAIAALGWRGPVRPPPAAPPQPPAARAAAAPPPLTAAATWPEPAEPAAVRRPLNILVLGVDEGGLRSDVTLVAHVDPQQGRINLVSLPRDSLVPIPCPADLPRCISPDKLGHAHAYGAARGRGPELAQATVEQFLGIRIDYWVRVDFAAFQGAVDLLGGITLDVEPGLSGAGLAPGLQRLDSWQALRYVRYRDGVGDIGRTRRAQRFAAAFLREVRDPRHRDRLPSLVARLRGQVQTDLDLSTALALAQTWSGREPPEVESVTLPGRATWQHNLWFWTVDEAETRAVVREYLNPPADQD